MSPSPLAPDWFSVFAGVGGIAILIAFVVVGLGIAATITFIVYAAVRNASKVAKAGHDPVTLQSDLAVRALDSALLSPVESTVDRLRELDDLLKRKVISATEHATARAAILAS